MPTNNRLFKIDLSMYKNGISKNMIIRFYKQIIYVILLQILCLNLILENYN